MEYLDKFFEYFAQAIYYVLNLKLDNRAYARYFANKRNSAMFREIRKSFPEMIDSKDAINDIDFDLLNHDFCCRLENYISEHHEDGGALSILIYCLDKAIIELYRKCMNFDNDVEKILPLNNNNIQVTGIAIFPRVRCGWEHESQGGYHYYSVDSFLHNFFYCKIDYLEEKKIDINNISLNSNFFREALNRDKLIICVSPVTNESVLVWNSYERDTEKLFHITDLENKDKIKENVLSAVKKSAGKKADILLFPEMLGTEDLRKQVFGELAGKKFPTLVIWPSIWKHNGNDVENTNSCEITIHAGESYDTVCNQFKNIGFDAGEKGREDLAEQEPWVINVLHCDGIGRIGILICRDYLEDDYRYILCSLIKCNLLLVPSFSSGAYSFEEVLSQYFEFDCNVAWCNTCAASNLEGAKIENFEKIAAITSRASNMKTGKIEVKTYAGIYKCRKDCRKCLFTREILFKTSVGER